MQRGVASRAGGESKEKRQEGGGGRREMKFDRCDIGVEKRHERKLTVCMEIEVKEEKERAEPNLQNVEKQHASTLMFSGHFCSTCMKPKTGKEKPRQLRLLINL